MKRYYIHTLFTYLFCSIIACSGLGPAFRQSTGQYQLNDPLPADPVVITGELENGLRYYIRENQLPENRAELKLVVNAGSVLEDDDQRGLAHFVEHMAFNGTAHFEKQELIDYMEMAGMRFGPEINAYTGFDETVYSLEIPTDSLQIVEQAFQILEDWGHLVLFEAEDIDRERGVIIEEWRLGRGAKARMRDQHFPILFKGSRYGERLPIGQKEIIESCKYEAIRRFYHDWYRPDLMAVIAVGDFDSKRILNLIRERFSGLESPAQKRERTFFPVPDHKETLFSIATDPEATSTSVDIYHKIPVRPESMVDDYRQMIIQGLFDDILNERLYELSKQSVPPFLYGYGGQSRFVRSKDVYSLSAGVKEEGIEKGLKTLMIETERIRLHGLTGTELERMKKEYLRTMEHAYHERDKTQSSVYASEYVRNFLYGEPFPGIACEYDLAKQYLPGITLDELNALASSVMTEENRVVLISAPEKDKTVVPTEGQLSVLPDRVREETIAPYQDIVSDDPLISELPEPSAIVNENYFENIDVTEWILANGVRVILKPTGFKNDEILFNAFSPGGHSLVPDSLFIAAATATSVIKESGLGGFSRIELNKKLAGKVVAVSPRIGQLTEGISGSAAPGDLETLFQLIYLYFTTARKDTSAFLSLKNRLKGYIENRSRRPETAFQDTLQVTLARHHFRARPWSLALLDEMNCEQSYRFFENRFADAGDFTFIFVGSFELKDIQPLIQVYLGGLPSEQRIENWKDLNIIPPDGVVKKIVKRGLEPKARVQLIFNGPYKWSRLNNYIVHSMIAVMRIHLREVLREDMGGTYGAGINASLSRYPQERYTINISFGCAPERTRELIDSVFTQIKHLKVYGPGEKNLLKIKESQIRQYEIQLKENSYWLGALFNVYYHGLNPEHILDYLDFVKGLSGDEIREAADQYFNMNQYVQAVLIPE